MFPACRTGHERTASRQSRRWGARARGRPRNVNQFAAGPDGATYFSTSAGLVRRVSAEGLLTTIAGNGASCGFRGIACPAISKSAMSGFGPPTRHSHRISRGKTIVQSSSACHIKAIPVCIRSARWYETVSRRRQYSYRNFSRVAIPGINVTDHIRASPCTESRDAQRLRLKGVKCNCK